VTLHVLHGVAAILSVTKMITEPDWAWFSSLVWCLNSWIWYTKANDA
jgi:hypothetical protein